VETVRWPTVQCQVMPDENRNRVIYPVHSAEYNWIHTECPVLALDIPWYYAYRHGKNGNSNANLDQRLREGG
jgi:hypothetical protein